MTPRIDGLQYANWSEKIFRQMRAGGVDAVHVTITYHETFRETVQVIERWNRWFELFPDLIFQGRTAADVSRARDMIKAYDAALAQGLGAVQYEGKMIDIASVRIVRNLVERADRNGM